MGRTFSSSSRGIGLLHPNAFENRRRESRSGRGIGPCLLTRGVEPQCDLSPARLRKLGPS